jgi:MYXO-CTERM domain-containing protein
VVKVGASDTFTLVPEELPCNGVQLLQVRAPKVRPAPAAGDRQGQGPMLGFYYLEMRSSYGFDGSLRPMVVVSIGADLPTAAQRGSPYLYVLDQAPGTATLNDAGLMTAGQSYQDPGGGLTITLQAIDARSATVSITTSAATAAHVCADQTAFTAPGLDATSCGALVGGGDAGPPVILPGNDAGPGARDAGNPGRNDSGARGGAGGVADAGAEASGRGGSSGGTDGATSGPGGSLDTGGTTGTGGAGGAATGGIAPATGTGGVEPVSGGCSCSTVGSRRSVPYHMIVPWAVTLVLGLERLRRRRASSQLKALRRAP